jgi:hypothetical protein
MLGMSDMLLDCAGGGVSVPLSGAASRSLLLFVASSDTRRFREEAMGASWASGLAGWLAGKGVSGVVAHATSNKVALPRIRHRVWFIGSILSRIPQKKFRYFSSSRSLKTEKFQKAIVIHFAIVVSAARHNFDGGNTTQICGKPR